MIIMERVLKKELLTFQMYSDLFSKNMLLIGFNNIQFIKI